MKWPRAVHHLEELTQACADMAGRPATIFPLHVTQLWAYGDVLSSRDDLEWLRVVLAVDLPVEDVAWLCPPVGAEHWSHMPLDCRRTRSAAVSPREPGPGRREA